MKYQLIEMPMGSGVNRYTDAPHLAHGELLTAVNLRFRDPPKLSHRYGHNQYTLTKFSGGSISKAKRLIPHKDSVLVADTDTMYSWAPTALKTTDHGYLSECLVKPRTGIFSDFTNTLSDASCTYSSTGYYIFAWTNGATHVAVVDEKSGSVVATQVLSLAGSPICLQPRVFMCGTTCWILTAGTGTSILYTKADLSSTLTFPALGTLGATAAVDFTDCAFDAAPVSSTLFVVAYESSADGNVKVDTFDQTPTLQNAASLAVTGDVTCIGVEGASGEGVFVAWGDTTNGIACTAYTTALVLDTTSVLNATMLSPSRAGIVRMTSTTRLIVWQEPAAGANRAHMAWRTKTFAGGPGAGTFTLYDVIPTGKPFLMNTDKATSHYVLGCFESDFQGTYYLIEIARDQTLVSGGSVSGGDGRWVAVSSRGLATPSNTSSSAGYLYGCAINGSTSGKVLYPGLVKKRFQYAGGEDEEKILSRARVDAITFDFANTKLHSAVSWGDGVFVAGGRPSWFDGTYAVEHGFAWYPQYMTVSAANAGGPLTTGTGAYSYSVTYECEDGNGYITRSAPWVDDIDLDVPGGEDTFSATWDQSLRLTARKSLVNKSRAFIYRTLVDETDPQYRGTAASVTTGFVTDAGTIVSFGTADTVVVGNDVCYTSGGILDNAGSPPCEFCCLHAGRVWIGGLEDPNTVWFSQPFVDREQPRFNEGLLLDIGSPVRALASMDGQLFVFTADGIHAVAGDGCPATGGVDVGFQVRRISTDVGIIDWRSLVLTPIGLFFQSRKGIYLLDRGLNTTYIGAPIDDYLSSRAEIVSAIAEEEHPTVMFLIKVSGGATASVRLVYDYQVKAWTVDTLPFIALDMKMVWDGLQQKRVPALITASDIWFEDSDIYIDGTDGTPVDTEVSWGDIKLSGQVQGWERIRMVQVLFGTAGTNGSASILIDFSFDYANTYTETHTFLISEQQAAGPRLQVDLTRQECQAVRVRVRELNEGNSGVHYRGIVFEGGIMPGANLLAAGAKR